ncbi:hypothetical protein CCMSSC00406_0010288 [Pleurotus cornucopiae]|uniref:Uncharacterized protein n=1 Tax=Pleurotus cornucopiae TaxID=5321 RepID=A0ACB7IXA5_PLECO|nr:hypothetical protein CCMSSC00406_0010288 [Pleurotus cornucopiae]
MGAGVSPFVSPLPRLTSPSSPSNLRKPESCLAAPLNDMHVGHAVQPSACLLTPTQTRSRSRVQSCITAVVAFSSPFTPYSAPSYERRLPHSSYLSFDHIIGSTENLAYCLGSTGYGPCLNASGTYEDNLVHPLQTGCSVKLNIL